MHIKTRENFSHFDSLTLSGKKFREKIEIFIVKTVRIKMDALF